MELSPEMGYRTAFERSVNEHRFAGQSKELQTLLKGQTRSQNLRKENLLNSYHQDSSHFDLDCDRAKDLRINKSLNETDHQIKQEDVPQLQRRYFCIFCKMDFLSADDFLDHLEMHPNGAFVLVKRDLPQPTPAPSETLESEEPSEHSPILPETLRNQIKIEPISDDEDEYQDYQLINEPVLTVTEGNEASPNSSLELAEPNDPNHQLLVLSNPRIGDGPGEYLCNVCNAKFVYKNNLKSHLKRHLGIYPYVCFCGKRYQFKCKLNKHIEQAHAKIKNFKCPVVTCPKKYFTRNDLAFHISVTHQERQEIPCHICNKVFNSQKSLQIHCRKYHRNQES